MEILGPYDPVAAKPASYSKIFVCQEQDGPCAQRIVTSLARKGLRRPPTEAEVARLVKLVAMVRRQGDSFEEGIRVALQSILVSPSFLFRIELDQNGDSGTYRVNDYELASRLSYFLWSSMPDKELLELASGGRLRDLEVRRRQVERMLASPKAAQFTNNFTGQWLKLRLLAENEPDQMLYPEYDALLEHSMGEETR